MHPDFSRSMGPINDPIVPTIRDLIQNLSGENSIKARFSVLFDALQAKGVNPQEIQAIAAKIERGSKMIPILLDINAPMPASTKEAVLDFTWLLMACIYQADNSVLMQSVTFYNLSHEQNSRIKMLYGNCTEANAHNCPVSGPKGTIGHQKELHFTKGELPPSDGKFSTLLCGRSKTGGVFIKLEREPLSVRNGAKTASHCWSSIYHPSAEKTKTTEGKHSPGEIEQGRTRPTSSKTYTPASTNGNIPRHLNQEYKIVDQIRQKWTTLKPIFSSSPNTEKWAAASYQLSTQKVEITDEVESCINLIHEMHENK